MVLDKDAEIRIPGGPKSHNFEGFACLLCNRNVLEMLGSRSPLKPHQLGPGPGFQWASSGSAKTAYLWCAETTPCKILPPGRKIRPKYVRFPRS